MMMAVKRVVWCVACALLMVACGKMQQPKHNKNTDETVDIEAEYELAAEDQEPPVVHELTTRQREAIEAENVVREVIKADTNSWVAHEFNWWYRYIARGETHREDLPYSATIADGTVIHEQVYTLSGQLLWDAIRQCRYDEPFAYERMIPYLVEGDTLLMIIPWYMAYDDKGNDYIPPKTNIRVILTIQK